MSKSIAIWLALFVVALAGGALHVPHLEAAGAQAVPPRWEYRVMTRQQVLDLGKQDLAVGLNKLGEEGWEFVAIDTQYIFKRPNFRGSNRVETLKQQLALVETDIEMRKDRLAWSERMARKGFMTEGEVQALKLKLKAAEMTRDWTKRELDAILAPGQKKGAEKLPTPGK
jgi:hypothetical protein